MLLMLQRTEFCDKTQTDISNSRFKKDAEKLYFECEIILEYAKQFISPI